MRRKAKRQPQADNEQKRVNADKAGVSGKTGDIAR